MDKIVIALPVLWVAFLIVLILKGLNKLEDIEAKRNHFTESDESHFE